MTLAQTEVERANWTALALALNPQALSGHQVAEISYADYQTPELAPRGGFVLDRALVYALVRQESRFNAQAVSPAGAVGLMQVMPATAALAARLMGAEWLVRGRGALRNPSTNLQIGQAYLSQVLERDTNFDILQGLAAYNGGPATVARTLQRLPDTRDPLMVMESLPFQETRNYVERVMANYWIYRQQFGQASPTLDAVISGAQSIDIRIDSLPGQNYQPVPVRYPATTSALAAPAATQGPQQAITPFGPRPIDPAAGGLIERPRYQQSLMPATPTQGGLQPTTARP